jgi:hypothetical protein
MLPENQTNKSPDKPYNQTRPLSARTSGSELDEGCEISQAEAGKGFDHALKLIDADRKPSGGYGKR